jgi:hypothetical protein
MFLQSRMGGDKSGITPRDAARALVSSFRVENPNVHDARTIDCASCHLAPVTRATLLGMGFSVPAGAKPFTSTHWNTESITSERVDNEHLQMFSYRPGGLFDPVVRPRVIAESAVVADYVNEKLPF